MSVTPEDLMAYADGELHGADKARVEAALAAEPDLQRVVDGHRALRSRLSAAYAPVIDEAVPDRLVAVVRAKPDQEIAVNNVVPLGAARAQRVTGQWGLREWAAMAAALLVGVIVGGQALSPGSAIIASNDGLRARGSLARALDTQLAADEGAVRIGVTFRTQSGSTCRTFVADGGALNGLACKEAGDWRVDLAMRGEPRPATQFRTAAAETSPEILARVDALIAGDPLDAAAEKHARDARWRVSSPTP